MRANKDVTYIGGLPGTIVAEGRNSFYRYDVDFGSEVIACDLNELTRIPKHDKPGEKFDHPSLEGRMDSRKLQDGDWFVYTEDPHDGANTWDDSLHDENGDGYGNFEKRRVGRHVEGMAYHL